MRLRALASALAAAAALSGSASAYDIIPVMNASLLGGQYFFKNDHSSLNGNVTALASPVIVRDEQWSFVPLLSANYQGTKGINDSVAAGTLFQQEMDQRVSFTAIDALPDSSWKLKPSVSYKREFLKETKDESWGHGLFDYAKTALGFEAENVYRDPFSYRLGFDVFHVQYVNYQSLESQAGVDPLGNPLGRENAGAHVLDSYNYQLSGSVTRPFPYDEPKVSLSAGYSLLYQDYLNDNLVDARGQNENGTRKDFVQTLSAGVGFPKRLESLGHGARLSSNLGVSVSVDRSNQNLFDAAQTQYVGDAYSYWQLSAGPSTSLSWGDEKRPATIGASFNYARTQYLGRLAQDPSGLYTSAREHQDRYSVGLSYAYPINTSMYLKAQSNLVWTRSNNLFETTYAYNYTSSNFLMGVAWEY